MAQGHSGLCQLQGSAHEGYVWGSKSSLECCVGNLEILAEMRHVRAKLRVGRWRTKEHSCKDKVRRKVDDSLLYVLWLVLGLTFCTHLLCESLTTILWGKYCYPHFTERQSGAQKNMQLAQIHKQVSGGVSPLSFYNTVFLSSYRWSLTGFEKVWTGFCTYEKPLHCCSFQAMLMITFNFHLVDVGGVMGSTIFAHEALFLLSLWWSRDLPALGTLTYLQTKKREVEKLNTEFVTLRSCGNIWYVTWILNFKYKVYFSKI